MPHNLPTLIAQAEKEFDQMFFASERRVADTKNFLRTHLALVAQEMERAIREGMPERARHKVAERANRSLEGAIDEAISSGHIIGYNSCRSRALEVVNNFINGKK